MTELPQSQPARWMALIRVSALIALTTSAMLLVDYMSAATPSFCGVGSGCDTVRRSGFGYVPVASTAIPVPLVGIVGFALLLGASLWPSTALRRKLTVALAILGGVIAVALIVVQWLVLGVFCTFCIVIDGLGIAAAVFAVAWLRSEEAVQREWLRPWAWISLAALGVAAPLLWDDVRPQPPVPDAIAQYYVPGKINVVEFADFECPFCRLLHGQLERIIADYGDRVNFVRLNVPLRSHRYARPAARAAICAEQQGKGEAMADYLFSAQDLRPRATRDAAAELGLDVEAFARCIRDAKTESRIRREENLIPKEEFLGLPTTYVGAERIVGAQPEEKFRDAFEAAARGEGQSGVPAPLFWTLAIAAAFGIVFAGRQSGARRVITPLTH